MRLVGNWVEQSVRTNFLGVSDAYDAMGMPGEVITLDPDTGEWSWDGVTKNDAPTYKLGGANEWNRLNYGNLQNDFVYEHSGHTWKSQTVLGYAFKEAPQNSLRLLTIC